MIVLLVVILVVFVAVVIGCLYEENIINQPSPASHAGPKMARKAETVNEQS